MQLVFRKLTADDSRPLPPGEVWLCPQVSGQQHLRRVALVACEQGWQAFPHGAGTPQVIVVDVNPTLDDLLGATFVMAALAGEPLPAGCKAFARYAALVREGLRPGTVPLEVSLEGIFQAIRNAHGEDLADPAIGALFVDDWRRMAQVLLAAAAAGQDPFTTALFAAGEEFARERAFLAKDRDVYQQDVLRGERWLVRLPEGPPQAAGLLLRRPKSLLFKDWSRQDRETPTGQPYLFLAVDWGAGQWVFSTDPVHRLSLKSLAEQLQAAEAGRDPDRAPQHPWFDGQPFGHTLVAAPRAGTVLDEKRLLGVVKHWTNARPCRPLRSGLQRLSMAAAAMAALVLLSVGLIGLRPVPSSPPAGRASTAAPREHQILEVRLNNDPCPRGLADVDDGHGAFLCVEQRVSLLKGSNSITFVEQNRFLEPRPVRLTVRVRAENPQTAFGSENVSGIRLNDQDLLAAGHAPETDEWPTVLKDRRNVFTFVLNNPTAEALPVVLQLGWRDNPRGMKLHVLSVGVATYPAASGFRPLRYADADARDVAQAVAVHWREKFQTAVAEPIVLVNEQAEKQQILAALERLTDSDVVKEHDLVVVVLSGHGERNPETGQYYFVPFDYEKDKLISTGLPWSSMKDAFASMRCRVVVILDTCHSGAAGLKGNTSDKLQVAVNKALEELGQTRRDIVILAACLGSESSLEDSQWQHGALSLAILECLAGKQERAVRADLESAQILRNRRGAGVITLADLGHYAEKRVRELVKRDQSVVLRAVNDIAPQQIPIGAYDNPE